MKNERVTVLDHAGDRTPSADPARLAGSPIGRRLHGDMARLFGRGDDNPARTVAHRRLRSSACRMLNQSIADCLDLQSQVRQLGWWLRGADYRAQRVLLADAAALIERQVGRLGQRIAALGGTAEGSVRQVAARSGLNDYPDPDADSTAQTDALVLAFGLVSQAMCDDAVELSERGDEVSARLSRRIAALLGGYHARLQPLLDRRSDIETRAPSIMCGQRG
ncbi:DNA starvation/stationary phase protection protein Dps [Salinisphaera sp. T5B8]|uniref:ferritin-like domain-containing protein n=1 Tax=Salinisphaera sp. T5B8 TaxID=1304154 RepID=UPI0033412EEF